MNVDNLQTADWQDREKSSAEELRSAFETFNRLSDQLADSYRSLQEQVASLTEELAQARSEKLEQLAEKERLALRLQKLMEALPGGVLVLDGHGMIVEANRGAREILGDGLIGRSWSDVSAEAFGTGNRELQLRDGRWLSLSSRALEEEGGRIVLLADVTETRRLQEMLDHRRRLAALGEMSASLAHQIRTPLSSVLLYLSQLDSPLLDQEKRTGFVARARERLRHLEKMVENMLAYARGNPEHQEAVEVRRLLEQLAQILETELGPRGGSLQMEGSVDDCALMGNPDALLGALVNLGMNAIEACEGTPRLLLEIRRVKNEVQISLADNGRGIPADLVEKVFEPFFTTRADGTGLGLAVVRAVVEGHGGWIEIRSSEGSGTRVRLWLPLAGNDSPLPSGRPLGALPGNPLHSSGPSIFGPDGKMREVQ